MTWVLTNLPPLLNVVGILCDIIGAFFVASEVVRQYRGKRYAEDMALAFDDLVIQQPPKETKQFQVWERLKYRNMKIGLVLLTFGFVLQLIANGLQFRSAT